MNYDLIKRLQALTPKGIKPKFEGAEWWKKFSATMWLSYFVRQVNRECKN